MSTNNAAHAVKIEAGQILNPESFPLPNELVCIEIPKVFDQAALRDCVTRSIVLVPTSGICRPDFSFRGVDNFDITEIKVISKTDSLTKPGFKKLQLAVRIKYDILYSDGFNHLTQPDEVVFNLTVREIYCPDCLAQAGVIRYPEAYYGTTSGVIDTDGSFLKVEALAEAFNDTISSCTGALLLDIGVFFIIKCECIVQLLIPSFGYCPVPPEQQNPAVLDYMMFSDRTRTPFPAQIFPDQKRNPLDM